MAFNAYMHERNIYRKQPDFAKLASDFPEFRNYVIFDSKGHKARVDFSNPEALRILTKILLKKDFNLDIEIPEGFLIPTVPQRLNYILWLEDLLCSMTQNKPKKDNILGVDIGTGACAIFAVLGAQKNNWKFIATESSEEAIMWAKKNIEKNNLHEHITVVKVNQDNSLDEVLSSDTCCYDFCMCNPPFFENSEEIRKKHPNSEETIADIAQKEEIFVKGGELDFVRNIVKASLTYKDRICIFTSMFGKKKNFLEISKDIKAIPDAKFTVTEFCQGNTIRWGIAWTFDQSIKFHQESKKRIKPKKAKTPLEYQILVSNPKQFQLDIVVKQAKAVLESLEIHFTVARSSQNFTELLLKSDRNTWTHQRRKRRELERLKKEGSNTKQTTAAISSDEKVEAHSKENGSESVVFNLSSESNINPGNNNASVVHVDIKTEAVTMDCTSTTLSENQELNTPDNIDSRNILQNVTAFDHDSDLLLIQSNKRKLDSDSDESSVHKKPKIDDCEKSVEDANKFTVCNSKVESVSSCDVNIHLKHDNSISTSNNSVSFLSDTSVTNSLGETDNKNISTKDSEDISTDSTKTKETEPEGIVLNCHLQFINGKGKVYVKMNCPPSADRNAMYQVFQLIKNKVNKC